MNSSKAMKGTLFVFLAFFLWQRPLRWIVALGLVPLVLAVPARLIDTGLSFGLAIWGGLAVLLPPFLLAPVAFRGLIANLRLGLLPHFHFRAGLALLLMTLLFAAWLPLAALYAGVPLHPLLFPRLFIGASLYAGLLQLILPSRHIVAIFSFLPFVIFLLLIRFGEVVVPLLFEPATVAAGLPLCAAGWTWGLITLHRSNVFRPVYQTASKDDWLYMDFGWSNRRGLGNMRSPAGTLLLGYPDGIGSRLLRMLNFTLVTPVVCVTFLYLIGPGNEDSDNPILNNLPAAFLGFCLFSALTSTWNYGEMAARCRLLWLRLGSGRPEHWRVMEGTIRLNLALLYATAALVALLLWLFTALPAQYPLHFMALLISRSLFDVYFNLFVRVKNWSRPAAGLLGLLSAVIALLVTGFAIALHMPLLLVALEALQLVLAVVFRGAALREFQCIDWRRVTLKPQARARAAGA